MKGVFTAISLAALLATAPAWAQNTSNYPALSRQGATFLTKAADGNHAEAELGRLAERQAGAPAVREFGRWMATDRTLANKRLKAVADRIGGEAVQPRLTQQDRALKDRLQGLRGAQFDARYTQAMVQDHERDIAVFRQEAQNGAGSLRMYAHTMLPVLEQHLTEARLLARQSGLAAGPAGRETVGSGSSIPRYSR